jgi:hypothetical protein
VILKELWITEDMFKDVTYFIRKYQPDALMTWNPNSEFSLFRHYLEHSDHRNSGYLALNR